MSALHRRDLDACLHYVRRANAVADLDAGLNCRLAEALLHDGRRETALECVSRALPAAGDDLAMLAICGWVFSNCACHDVAASVYVRLIELCPDWIEGHRHASASLAAIGRIDEAIAHAAAASERAPANPEFAHHAGVLLLAAGHDDAALRYLARSVAAEPDNVRALCDLAAARHALGQGEEAAALILRAVDLAPGDNRILVDAAELLMRCDRADEAAELLGRAASSAAATAADPRLLRVLSTAQMLRGNWEAALAAIDRALAGAPDVAEYHLHRGHLLWRLGDLSGAALAFERAGALDPTGSDIKRAQLSLYLAAGLTRQATVAGGELLHNFPDDRPSAEAVLHLLNHRLDTIDGEYVVLADGAGRPPRKRRPAPGVLDRLRSQRRVIRALIIRETRTRYAESRLGYGWALIEPVLHIALLSATFAVLMQSRPPIGTHFFVFYYTGLIRYYGANGTKYFAITGYTYLTIIPIRLAQVRDFVGV